MSANEDNLNYLTEYVNQNHDSMTFARLADAHLQVNRIDEAIQLCEEGIKKHPYYPTGHFILGKCYMAKKDHDLAEKEFKRVLLFDPKYLAAQKYYGDLMNEIGWENTSEMSYKKILQIDPLDEVARAKVKEFAGREKTEDSGIETEAADSPLSAPASEVETIAPLPVTPEEEKLIFEDEEKSEATQTNESTETSEVPPELDEKKAEEYSTILDDIFEDETVEEASKSKDEAIEETASEKIAASEKETTEDTMTEVQVETDQEEPVELTEPTPKPSVSEEASETPEEISDTEITEVHDLQREVPEAPDEPSHEPEEMATKTEIEPADVEMPEPSPKKPSKRKGTRGDKIVTTTLGEIYAAQGQLSKAIYVFETLLKKHPENKAYKQKISFLKHKLAQQKDEAKT